MVFPYIINTNIPDAPNDPADDQPIMKQNYANIAQYLSVDHVAAGTNPGAGFHKLVTLNDVAAPAAPLLNLTVLYTSAGTASTVPDLRFRNSNGIFPISLIRATVSFIGDSSSIAGAAMPFTNGFNVVKVERTASTFYKITMTANATTDPTTTPKFMVFIQLKNGNTTGYNIAADTVSSLNIPDAIEVNILVVQI